MLSPAGSEWWQFWTKTMDQDEAKENLLGPFPVATDRAKDAYERGPFDKVANGFNNRVQ
jgi:hypothetical protein